MDKFTIDDFLEIQEKHEDVRKDDTPYAVHGYDDKLAVVGDANKIDTKDPLSITITFRFLKNELDKIPSTAKVVGSYIMMEKVFDNVVINGRNDTYLVEALLGMYPLIKAFDEINREKNKNIEDFNKKYGLNIDYSTYVPEQSNLSESVQEELNEILYTFNLSIIQAYNSAGEVAQTSIYKFVAKLLKIDETLEEHMVSASVISCITKIMKTYPELFNEAETVFSL